MDHPRGRPGRGPRRGKPGRRHEIERPRRKKRREPRRVLRRRRSDVAGWGGGPSVGPLRRWLRGGHARRTARRPGVGPRGGLLWWPPRHTSHEAQHQQKCGFIWNVVIGERAAIFQLLASKDEALLVRWDPFLVLDRCMHVINGVTGLHVQCNGFAREGFDEKQHTSTEVQHQVKGGFLLSVILTKRARKGAPPILKLNWLRLMMNIMMSGWAFFMRKTAVTAL